jgi:hypothetical protein
MKSTYCFVTFLITVFNLFVAKSSFLQIRYGLTPLLYNSKKSFNSSDIYPKGTFLSSYDKTLQIICTYD